MKKSLLEKILIAKVEDEEGSFETYVKAIENGKFRNMMFYGVGERQRGFVFTDPTLNPGALYIGGMGSGKSIAMRTTLVTHMCTNSQDTIYILMDPLKGMTDYAQLFDYKKNVAVSLNDPAKIVPVIDMIHKECMARKKRFSEGDIQASNIHQYNKIMRKRDPNYKGLASIILCIEEFHAIPSAPQVKFHMNVDRHGSTAYKMKELLRVGRSYGISMMAATQRATTDDVPSTLKAGLSQTMAFRVNSPGDATAANLPEAASISKNQKGRCITQEGYIQFPYIDNDTAQELLDKYYKPLEAELLNCDLNDFHKAFEGEGNRGQTKVAPLKELIEFANQFKFSDIVDRFLEEFDFEVEVQDNPALGVSSIAVKNGEKYAVLALEDRVSSKFVKEKFEPGMKMLGCNKVLAITLDSRMPTDVETLAKNYQGSYLADKDDLLLIADTLDNKEKLKADGRFDEIYERLIFVKKEKDEEFLEECQPTEEKNKFERPKTSTGGTAALMDLRAKLKEELEKAKKGS